MSTQESKIPSIPFSIAQDLQNVRLLEVSEELLHIIANTQQPLYFKSTPALSQASNGTEGKEGNVHLCTDDKVWAVKQVSTSNSVYVTKISSQTQAIPNGDIDHEEDSEDHVQTEVDGQQGKKGSGLGISAIAKPTSILELHALPPATYEAIVLDHLGGMVPTITSADASVAEGSTTYNLADIHNHIPAPASIIRHILAQRCAFEISSPGSLASDTIAVASQAYIPSSRLLLSIWTEIMEVATLTSTQITGFLTSAILNEGVDNTGIDSDLDTTMSEDQQTKPIYKAISKRLFQENGHLTSLGVINKDTGTLDNRECTRWVGNLILAAAKEDQHNNDSEFGLSKDGFEKKWEDNVPASWIKYCSIEVLRPACTVTTVDGTDMVRWAPFALEDGGPSDGAIASDGKPNTGGGSVAPAGSTKNKRKWHEKFASQRNLKK